MAIAAARAGLHVEKACLLDEAMRRRTRTAASVSTVLYARVCPGADATALTLASGGHPRPLILTAEGDVWRIETPGTLVGRSRTRGSRIATPG